MKPLEPAWMHVSHHEILKQLQIEPQSPSGIEALERMAVWERDMKPGLEAYRGMTVIREPSPSEPGTVYCAVTLGNTLSKELDNLSRTGRMWEAMVLDALADHWLIQAANRQFDEVAALCRTHGWGLTTRKMPGSGYPLSMAKKIVAQLDPEAWVLKYVEPGFLEPIKSLAYFYETHTEGTIPFHDEECANCSREACPRKRETVQLELILGSELITVPAKRGENLLTVLQQTGHAPDAPCGGRGVCGRCRVEIQTDADDREWVSACKVTAEMPMKVWVPVDEAWQMATDPSSPALLYEPVMTRIPAQAYFMKIHRATSVALAALSAVQTVKDTQHSGWFLEKDGRIVGYTPEQEPLIGAAIDLGSTTIVIKLLDLESGSLLSVEGFPNPLRIYGADILSRLTDATRLQEMSRLLRHRLAQLLDAPRHKSRQPAVFAIGGNNAMAQILLGLSSEGLARAPYWHWLHSAAEMDAGDLWPERAGIVTVMPGISPFTGGDLTAGIIHCGIHETQLKTLYLDLGTNGEMALGDSGGIFVTAAAAGPAFESLESAGGVGAIQGAVKRVRCLGSGRWNLETIEDKPPIGLCGSGIISLIAELLRYGFIGSDGTLSEEEESAVCLAPGIEVTQQDIRSFQLAKAAFRAGIEVLLKQKGWQASELEQVIIAGGFSRDISAKDLLATGFLPAVDSKIIQMAGNACLGGLCDFLLNKDARNGIYKGTETMQAVNLGETPDFEALFIRHINFK